MRKSYAMFFPEHFFALFETNVFFFKKYKFSTKREFFKSFWKTHVFANFVCQKMPPWIEPLESPESQLSNGSIRFKNGAISKTLWSPQDRASRGPIIVRRDSNTSRFLRFRWVHFHNVRFITKVTTNASWKNSGGKSDRRLQVLWQNAAITFSYRRLRISNLYRWKAESESFPTVQMWVSEAPLRKWYGDPFARALWGDDPTCRRSFFHYTFVVNFVIERTLSKVPRIHDRQALWFPSLFTPIDDLTALHPY